MPITIGNTTITGLAADGLPDNIIGAASLADGTVGYANINSSVLAGNVVQTQFVASTTKSTLNPGNTLAEPNSNYRVSITPLYSNSIIMIHYHIPLSWSTGWFTNTVCRVNAKRFVSGSPQNISTAGTVNGSRPAIAGFAFRPGHGTNSNDMNNLSFTVYDAPATTSAIQYGFHVSNEGGTMVFGYSDVDDSGWGWNANIIIIAEEIKQ
jgi:hypothetical protein